MKEGFILINKPKGITSFGVVARIRKITGVKKIGHCGTLDPLASGLLICAIGRSATKRIDLLMKQKKVYLAEIELGRESDTYDLEGNLKKIKIVHKPSEIAVKKALELFVGEIEQLPPIYSAKKINGRKAYELARRGLSVEMKANKVMISKIKLIRYKFPILKIKIWCSGGTYIRSLAHDIGIELSTGAVLVDLVREKIGKYSLKKSVKADDLDFIKIEKNIFEK